MKKVKIAWIICICIFIAGLIVMSSDNPLGQDAAIRHADRTGIEYTQAQVNAFVYTVMGVFFGLPLIAFLTFLGRTAYRAWKNYKWINGRAYHGNRTKNKGIHLHDSAPKRMSRERKKPD